LLDLAERFWPGVGNTGSPAKFSQRQITSMRAGRLYYTKFFFARDSLYSSYNATTFLTGSLLLHTPQKEKGHSYTRKSLWDFSFNYIN
jgi:hypothetical protein